MQTITAVIPALNEEKNLARVLKSVEWCNKIWVMDMGSTDGTESIARKFGVHFEVRNQGKKFIGVQENVNWAGKHCGTDWVLRIDADEEVTPELRFEIRKILDSSNSIIAYGVPRRQYFLGGFLKGGDWAYDRLVRLYKSNNANYDLRNKVHEQFVVRGSVSELKNPLNHYSHQSWSEINKKWQLYTDLESSELRITKMLALFKMITVPWYVFGRWMIWHRGWIDGWRGIVAGGCRAWYDYLKFYKYLTK